MSNIQLGFRSGLDYRTNVRATLAFESSQTEAGKEDVNIKCFAILPAVGTYILSNCRTKAMRVLRHQKATACGNNLTIVFIDEPTEVTSDAPHGNKSIAIEVHNQKCTTHHVEAYYLTRKKGFKINATLL